MRYFNYLSAEDESSLFFIPPVAFNNKSDKELLSRSLGALLYMPATRRNIAKDIIEGKCEGLVSAVLDLEDGIGDQQVSVGEESIVLQLKTLASHVRTGVILWYTQKSQYYDLRHCAYSRLYFRHYQFVWKK